MQIIFPQDKYKVNFFSPTKDSKLLEGGKKKQIIEEEEKKKKLFTFINLRKKNKLQLMHCDCRNKLSLSTVMNNKI